jgi:hypothetical protein
MKNLKVRILVAVVVLGAAVGFGLSPVKAAATQSPETVLLEAILAQLVEIEMNTRPLQPDGNAAPQQ